MRRSEGKVEGGAGHELDSFKLVVLMGVISLFVDMTGDGYYSVVGPYLGSLGATAAIITIITGVAGLVAFTPRLAAGWYCDRTGHYWDIIAAGVIINFVAAPLLALAGHWELAMVVIIFERLGKAIRAPGRDAIISHAAPGMGGAGRAFGLHEAMSDIGSIVGPIFVALMLQANLGYQMAIAILAIPGFLAVLVVYLSSRWYPNPMDLEPCPAKVKEKKARGKLPRIYWIYIAATGLIAASFIDFPLISYHMSVSDHLASFWIPMLFALAMALDAVSAILFGHVFDRVGVITVAIVFAIAAFFVPLVFGTDPVMMVLGVALWGIGQGALGSIVRAAIAEMVPQDRRGAAYGVYATNFGVLWFIGNAALGVLYTISVPLMIVTSLAIQFIAVGIIVYIQREIARKPELKCPM